MFVFESILTALKKEHTGSTQAVCLSSSSSCDSSEEISSDAMSDSSTSSSSEEDKKKKRRKKKGKERKSKKSKKMKLKTRKRGKICYMYFHPLLLTGFLVWSCLALLYNCSSPGWFFSHDVTFCV